MILSVILLSDLLRQLVMTKSYYELNNGFILITFC